MKVAYLSSFKSSKQKANLKAVRFLECLYLWNLNVKCLEKLIFLMFTPRYLFKKNTIKAAKAKIHCLWFKMLSIFISSKTCFCTLSKFDYCLSYLQLLQINTCHPQLLISFLCFVSYHVPEGSDLAKTNIRQCMCHVNDVHSPQDKRVIQQY